MDTPFHDGEIALQNATGERRLAERSGRFISPRLTANGARFLETAPVANFALSDDNGAAWSFFGAAGGAFIHGVDENTVAITGDGLAIPDQFWQLAQAGAQIGIVAMDLTNARRLRINGVIDAKHDGNTDRILLQVTQTCPNCPKYIQQRLPVRDNKYETITASTGKDLNDDLRGIISAADTFFVASRDPEGNHDASHRGGHTGFVRAENNQLIIPDYIGNSMFMTLGNLTREPVAGISFVDFDRGLQLNLTGRTEIELNDPKAHDGTEGRYWLFDVTAWSMASFRPTPGWALASFSNFNPQPRG